MMKKEPEEAEWEEISVDLQEKYTLFITSTQTLFKWLKSFFFPLYPQILRKKRSLNKGCFLPVSSLDHSRLLTALFCSGRIMHLNSKEISVESAMNPTPFSPFSWGGFCRPRTPRALALPQRQPGGLPGGGGTHRNP